MSAFDFIRNDTQTTIIEDADPLQPNHIPDDILHREDEINRIINTVFKPAYRHGTPENIVISGPSGTGKTATMKILSNRFKQTIQDNNQNSDISISYINCESNANERDVTSTLLENYGLQYEKGLSPANNLSTLYNQITRHEGTYIIILDEADSLIRDTREYLNNVLYKLLRPEEVYAGFDGNISVVMISNDLQLQDMMDESVQSSFGGQQVMFQKYTEEEIREILHYRQKKAFVTPVIPRDILQDEIGTIVRTEFNGDIRMGMRILRDAAVKLEDKLEPNQRHKTEEKQTRKTIRDTVRSSSDTVKQQELEQYLASSQIEALLALYSWVKIMKNGKDTRQPMLEQYKYYCKCLEATKKYSKDIAASTASFSRMVEQLVDNNLLNKYTRVNQTNNPVAYKPSYNVEIIEKVCEEQLCRRGIMESIRDGVRAIENEQYNPRRVKIPNINTG